MALEFKQEYVVIILIKKGSFGFESILQIKGELRMMYQQINI